MEPMEDAECRARIEKHRRQRAGKGFVTIERGVDLAGLALPARGDVLLEDLGNLTANEPYSPAGAGPAGPPGGPGGGGRGCESLPFSEEPRAKLWLYFIDSKLSVRA